MQFLGQFLGNFLGVAGLGDGITRSGRSMAPIGNLET
jgi:hypothetical protein